MIVVWGAVIGIAGGLIGLGGAEFRIPLLVGLMGWRPRSAVPINLAISFAVLLAALPVRAATLGWSELKSYAPETLGLAAGSVCAAFFGAGLLQRMEDAIVSRIVFALLAALGLVLIGDAFLSGAVHLLPESPALRIAAGATCGAVIGLVSSLLGVAGGELIIPTLVLGFAVPMKSAGSLAMLVGLPTIAAGLLRHARVPDGPLRQRAAWRGTIVPFGIGSIVGAVVGASLVDAVDAFWLKLALGTLLIWSSFQLFRGHARRG